MVDFITGPLFVISLVIFVVGMLARVFLYVNGLDWRLERVAYRYHANRSIAGIFASIFKWLIPGGTDGWRTQPVAAVLFFLLHFGAVLVPFFLLGCFLCLSSQPAGLLLTCRILASRLVPNFHHRWNARLASK